MLMTIGYGLMNMLLIIFYLVLVLHQEEMNRFLRHLEQDLKLAILEMVMRKSRA